MKMGDESIREVAERHLAKERPINEMIGVAVNATAWVALSVFLMAAVWHVPELNNNFVSRLFRFSVTVVAGASSLLAAYGLFMPIYRITAELRHRPGLPWGLLHAACLWILNICVLVWMIAVAFTFIGLARSIYAPF